MNLSRTFHYLRNGRMNANLQGTKEQANGRRYQNHRNPLTGFVTIGLKPGRERGLVPKGGR